MAKSIEYNEKWFKESYSRVFVDKKTDWLSYKAIAKFVSQDLNKKSLVFEAGCGLGTLCCRLSEYFERVIGMDISEYACSKAQSIYNRKKINFVVADVEKMPFKSEVFDGVVVSHLFEHLNDLEAENTQKQIYKILKPNGQLIVEQPVYGKESILDVILLFLFSSWKNKQLFYYTHRAIKIAKRQNPQTDFYHIEKVGNPTHKRIYDIKLLVDELSKAGFGKFKFARRRLFSILFFNRNGLFERYVKFYLKAPEIIRRIFLINIGCRIKAIKL